MAPYVENRVISDEWKERFPTSDDITFQDLKEIFTADLDEGTTVFDGNVKDINRALAKLSDAERADLQKDVNAKIERIAEELPEWDENSPQRATDLRQEKTALNQLDFRAGVGGRRKSRRGRKSKKSRKRKNKSRRIVRRRR
jgi:uncharacterized membrane protein YukC